MTRERYQRINDLADAALKLRGDARATFLRRYCDEDEDLLRRVNELVRILESGVDPFAVPALELLAQDLAEARASSGCDWKLGRYDLVSLIGAGGMGEVWLARDTRLQREVALKILAAELTIEPASVQRFEREARAASALNHPNVVTVHDFGEDGGTYFLAQEFVPGETLRSRLRRGRLTPGEALDITAQIAAALEAAHKVGVVHRDIKPENVLLRPDGVIKVVDFGLARFQGAPFSSGLHSTLPGMIMGTVRYMSPEQARGQDTDARTDLFSLGAILFEALAGEPAFPGDTPSDVLVAILGQEPPCLSDYASGIPRDLERIVDRCLAKNRERRYASAEDLRRDLLAAQAIAGEGSRSGSTGRKRAAIRVKLRPSAVAVAAGGSLLGRWLSWRKVAACAGITGLVMVLHFARRPIPLAEPVTVQRLPTQGNVVEAALSPDGTEVAYASAVPGGRRLWIRPAVASGDSRPITPPSDFEYTNLMFSSDGLSLYFEGRDGSDSDLYHMGIGGGTPRLVLSSITGRPALSRDGKRIAFVRLDRTLWQQTVATANADGTGERVLFTRRRPNYLEPNSLAWSPDGESILGAAGSMSLPAGQAYGLIRVRERDGSVQSVPGTGWQSVGSLFWTSANLALVSGYLTRPPAQLWQTNLHSGALRHLTNDLAGYLRLSPCLDGTKMAALREELFANLWIAPADRSGQAIQVSSGNLDGFEGRIDWLPGRRISYESEASGNLDVWTIRDDGQEARQIASGPNAFDELTVTRDGRYYLYHSRGRIWRMDSSGSHAVPLTEGPLDVHPAVSPDGRFVVYASFEDWARVIGGRMTLRRISIMGGTPIQLTGDAVSLPDVSPDGRWIACVRFSDTQGAISIVVLPFDGGPIRQEFALPAGVTTHPRWRPDGTAISYARSVNGIGNVWSQPLAGGAPVQVTHFAEEEIFNFGWAPNGSRIALSRGRSTRTLVLMSAGARR